MALRYTLKDAQVGVRRWTDQPIGCLGGPVEPLPWLHRTAQVPAVATPVPPRTRPCPADPSTSCGAVTRRRPRPPLLPLGATMGRQPIRNRLL
jgi:hypothetical protein